MTQNILVVDDIIANLDLLVKILGEHGYQVRAALNGPRALATVRKKLPDLVLLDVVMPEMSGYQVCERLKADERTRDIPVIFISALNEVFDKVKAFSVGGVDYITKPFHVEEVLARVKTHMALRNTQKSLQQEIVERKWAEDALQQRNSDLALLNRVSHDLAATLDLPQIATQLLQATAEIVGAEVALLWLWDEGDREDEQGELVCWAIFHRGQDHPPTGLRLRSGQGIAGAVMQSGESIVISTSDDPRFLPGFAEQAGFHTTSLVATPLQVRNRTIGVLEVVNKLDGDFDTADRILIETVSASAAIAIDNATLVEVLSQRTVELEERTVELEERNEELDAFAHTVAHDLKNPLNLVVGYSELLVDDIATLGKAPRKKLDSVVRSGRKMGDIINALLLLAGVREMEADVMPLDMEHIVSETLHRLTLLIKEHQAEIILPDTWPVALGYKAWVEEVWTNYLSNAIKYGGRPPRVELGATEQSGPSGQAMVHFWVRDNGAGISAEAQKRLFTPFTRLEQANLKGHGLGLSIVRRIVEKLGGKVDVESQEGQGSTFGFTLPVPPPNAPET